MGVLIFCMYFGFFPFELATNNDAFYKHILLKDYQEFWSKIYEYDQNIKVSEEMKNFFENIFTSD